MAKILDNNGVGVSQQLVNTHPTISQHPDPVGQAQNFSVEKGEREGTKSSPPNGVLQTPVQREMGKGEIVPYSATWMLRV